VELASPIDGMNNAATSQGGSPRLLTSGLQQSPTGASPRKFWKVVGGSRWLERRSRRFQIQPLFPLALGRWPGGPTRLTTAAMMQDVLALRQHPQQPRSRFVPGPADLTWCWQAAPLTWVLPGCANKLKLKPGPTSKPSASKLEESPCSSQRSGRCQRRRAWWWAAITTQCPLKRRLLSHRRRLGRGRFAGAVAHAIPERARAGLGVGHAGPIARKHIRSMRPGWMWPPKADCWFCPRPAADHAITLNQDGDDVAPLDQLDWSERPVGISGSHLALSAPPPNNLPPPEPLTPVSPRCHE